jgi:hypothetical protein
MLGVSGTGNRRVTFDWRGPSFALTMCASLALALHGRACVSPRDRAFMCLRASCAYRIEQARTHDQYTPLHLASWSGANASVMALLEMAEKKAPKDVSGRCALTWRRGGCVVKGLSNHWHTHVHTRTRTGTLTRLCPHAHPLTRARARESVMCWSAHSFSQPLPRYLARLLAMYPRGRFVGRVRVLCRARSPLDPNTTITTN